MRLLLYRDGQERHVGVARGEDIIDLSALAAIQGHTVPNDLIGLIDLGETGLDQVRRFLDAADDHAIARRVVRPLNKIAVGAPLDPPRGNVVAIGRNYPEHAEESARARQEELQPPTVFTKAQTSIVGPYDDIPVQPTVTAEVDWEAELAVVIGRRALNVPASRAMEYVYGYTVVNDVSARDVQFGWGGQFFKGKSLDGFCPLGPWIVTADEIPDPQNLRIMCRVNGETKQDANTRDMIMPVADLIARLSDGMTLLPGTVIATGTPPGVGFARTPKEFLQPGDVMETEVGGVGVLRNRIVHAR